jgi:hypothetical protein
MTHDLTTTLALARELTLLKAYRPRKRRSKRSNKSRRARIVKQIRKAFAGGRQ